MPNQPLRTFPVPGFQGWADTTAHLVSSHDPSFHLETRIRPAPSRRVQAESAPFRKTNEGAAKKFSVSKCLSSSMNSESFQSVHKSL